MSGDAGGSAFGAAARSREPGAGARDRPRTLVGGVGYRWQRDASFGLAVSDALTGLEWPPGVEVADLGYGALHVVDDLRRTEPPWERLILVAAAPRDRESGRLYRRELRGLSAPPDQVQARIREAGAGVIDLDHLLVIADHFGVLPGEVVLFELEPEDTTGGEGLSESAASLLPEAVERVRAAALGGRPAGLRKER